MTVADRPFAGPDISAVQFKSSGSSTSRSLATRFAQNIVDARDWGVVADGVTDDTAALQAAINANAGNFIALPQAAMKVSSTLILNSDFTGIGSLVGGQTGHDVGTSPQQTTFSWAGAAGGTILKVAPVTGASAQALTGVKVTGITFQGNSLAGIGMQAISVRESQFSFLNSVEVTVVGFDFGSYVHTLLGEASDFNSNEIFSLNGRQIINAAPTYRLWSSATLGASGNVSFNSFRNLSAQYMNAPAMLVLNADNNIIQNIHFNFVMGGTAIAGLVASNDVNSPAGNNTYFDCSSTTLFRGGASITIGGSAQASDVVSLTFSSSQVAGFPLTVNYTVVGGDTTATIATGLVNALNANSVLSTIGFVAANTTVSNPTPTNTITLVPSKTSTVFGEVAISYTQGTNTETVALSPSDGIIVCRPVTLETILITDNGNSISQPVIAPGAQVSWLEANGTAHRLAMATTAFGGSGGEALVARDQAAAVYTASGGPVAYFYDNSQFGWYTQGPVGKIRVLWDSNGNWTSQRQAAGTAGVIWPLSYVVTSNATIASTGDTSAFGAGAGSQNFDATSANTTYTLKMSLKGNYSTPAANTATLTPKIKIGSTTIATGAAITMPSSATGWSWWVDAQITIRSAGTSGSVVVNGGMYYVNGVTGTVNYVDLSTTSPVTVNTVGKYDFTLAWSSVAGGQTATGVQGSLEMH